MSGEHQTDIKSYQIHALGVQKYRSEQMFAIVYIGVRFISWRRNEMDVC